MYNSVQWRTGEDGSNAVSLNIIFASPWYHDPLISLGILTSSATEGMIPNLVKSWSDAWRR